MSPNQQRTLPPLSNEQQQQIKQNTQDTKYVAVDNLNTIVITTKPTTTTFPTATDYHHPQHHQYQSIELRNNSQMCSENRTNDSKNIVNITALQSHSQQEQRKHLINKNVDSDHMNFNIANKNSVQLQQQINNNKSSQLKDSHSALVKILESAPINNTLKSNGKSVVSGITTAPVLSATNPSYTCAATTFSGSNAVVTVENKSTSSHSSILSARTVIGENNQTAAVQFNTTLQNINTSPASSILSSSSLPSNLLVNKWINQQQNTNSKSYHHHNYHRKRNKHLIDTNTYCDNMNKNDDMGQWKNTMRLSDGRSTSISKDEDGRNSNSSASSNTSEAEIVCPWKKTRIAREWHQSHNMSEDVMDQTILITGNDPATVAAPALGNNQTLSENIVISVTNAKTGEIDMDQQQNEDTTREQQQQTKVQQPLMGEEAEDNDDMCSKNGNQKMEIGQKDEIRKQRSSTDDEDEDDDDDEKASLCECSNTWQRTSNDSDSNESTLNNSTDSGCDSDCPENISELCKQFDEHLSEQEVIFILYL